MRFQISFLVRLECALVCLAAADRSTPSKPPRLAVQMEVEKDNEKFSVSRVRDEASTIVRSLIRLAETMKPVPEVRMFLV